MTTEIKKPKINYIIATYAGISARESNDSLCKYALQYHMRLLRELLTADTMISQITIIRPHDSVVIDNTTNNNTIYPEYYDIEEECKRIFEKTQIPVVFFDTTNDPVGVSYSQYMKYYQSLMDADATKQFDYYLIFEDDWCINLCYDKFDVILTTLYEQAIDLHQPLVNHTLPSKYLFLNCWSPITGSFVNLGRSSLHGGAFHSAISVGMMNEATFTCFMKKMEQIHHYLKCNFLID